jgi:hypothetical protein
VIARDDLAGLSNPKVLKTPDMKYASASDTSAFVSSAFRRAVSFPLTMRLIIASIILFSTSIGLRLAHLADVSAGPIPYFRFARIQKLYSVFAERQRKGSQRQ